MSKALDAPCFSQRRAETSALPFRYTRWLPTDGRVPGAVWGRDTDEYRDAEDGSLRSYDEIKNF